MERVIGIRVGPNRRTFRSELGTLVPPALRLVTRMRDVSVECSAQKPATIARTSAVRIDTAPRARAAPRRRVAMVRSIQMMVETTCIDGQKQGRSRK